MNRALLALLLLGCGDEAPVLRPLIDTPDLGPDPYQGLEEIQLAIARSGQDTDLVAATFRAGDPMSLPTVPFEDDLIVHMIGRAEGVEAAYGRTCRLDLERDSIPDHPRLYFAHVNEWAEAVPPEEDQSREHVEAYTLSDGSAVFVGGGASVDSAVRFQPLDGSFAPLGPTIAMRDGAVLAPVGDGDDRALIVGGAQGGDGVTFIEVLNPTGDNQLAMVNDAPRLLDHAAATLPGGGVLVTGGRVQADAGSPFLASNRAWVFRLSDAGFLEDPTQAEVGALVTARAGATLTRLDDERGVVLVAGGEDDAGAPVGASELFVPSAGEFVAGPPMGHPRSHHAALRMGGFVVIVGGIGAGGAPVEVIEVYDTLRGMFYESPERLPSTDSGVTGFSATLLADGTALFAGGTDALGEVSPVSYLIQLDASGTLTLDRISDLTQVRTGHAAALLCDGTVLVVGGRRGDEHATERFNPRGSGRRR